MRGARAAAVCLLPLALAPFLADDVHPHGHDREGLPVADVPMALYADDPQHWLNQLHQALFIAELQPEEVGAALPGERRAQGQAGAEFFAPKWYFRKRPGTADDRGVFGGDVRFSPVQRLDGARAERVRALLARIGSKERVAALAELRAPLVRLLVQWDVLSLWWRCERDGTADAATLQSMARAIVALAQPRAVLQGLAAGTDELRAAHAPALPRLEPSSAAERLPAADAHPDVTAPYFPADLLAPASSFVEIERDDKALFHAERSLRAVRAFVRVPAGRDASVALVRAAGAAGRDGPLPEVPIGSEVALVLSLLGVDDAHQIVATPVVDEVRVRRIVGGARLAADNGSTRDGVSHWVYLRSRRASRGAAAPDAAPAFRFVPETTQAMFLEYGTLKHTTYFAQCALCHRLTDSGKQTPAGITSLGRFAGARVCEDQDSRLRRAEVQAAKIGERLRARL